MLQKAVQSENYVVKIWYGSFNNCRKIVLTTKHLLFIFANCHSGFYILDYHFTVKVHLNVRLTLGMNKIVKKHYIY